MEDEDNVFRSRPPIYSILLVPLPPELWGMIKTQYTVRKESSHRNPLSIPILKSFRISMDNAATPQATSTSAPTGPLEPVHMARNTQEIQRYSRFRFRSRISARAPRVIML